MPYSKSISSSAGPGRDSRGLGATATLPAGDPGHPGAGADRRVDVALRHQLLVDLHHRAARDPQLVGQPSGRRQSLRRRAAGPHGSPPAAAPGSAERGEAGAVQGDQQVGRVAARSSGISPVNQMVQWRGPKWTFRADRLESSIDPWASDWSWH